MKILQRYLGVSVLQAVAFVLTALLALNAFMDLTGEVPQIGKDGYALQDALLYVLLLVPFHIYQSMPVAALIGTIYAMAQFASSSEFTIMRASGMSTRLAAWMLFKVGFVLVVVTLVFGELVAPRTAPMAESVKLGGRGAAISQGMKAGMWTKDIVRSEGIAGRVTGSRFFNVRTFKANGEMLDVRLYEFDTSLRLRSLITSKRAVFTGNNTWRLEEVTENLFSNSGGAQQLLAGADGTFGQATSIVGTRKLASMELVSEITPKIISVSASAPDRMSANELAVYTRHLSENKQETERFKIAFWKKLIDPLSIFVLMALALPFAYLHTRSGGVSLKIFIGIMIGVGFIVVNNLAAHIGLLSSVPPFVTAIAPSLLFLALALTALMRVERYG
ncbi:MAG: LPS export ABC transporter permease LptG [Pseudomonadota bacterium]